MNIGMTELYVVASQSVSLVQRQLGLLVISYHGPGLERRFVDGCYSNIASADAIVRSTNVCSFMCDIQHACTTLPLLENLFQKPRVSSK